MSSHTWTPTELQSNFRSYAGEIWRGVEAQHRVSTMRLVDSLDEQRRLEDVIEASKPSVPSAVAKHNLHFLLFTPFRYRPDRHASRFRRYGQKEGVFYGAENVSTVLAEIAFHRFRFMADAPDAPPPTSPIEYTLFSAQCASDKAIDLRAAPFDRDQHRWEKLDDYSACQTFADIARDAGVHIINYTSVRDLLRGANIAILDARAFASPRPIAQRSISLLIRKTNIIALAGPSAEAWEFPLAQFSQDARLKPLV